MMASSHIIFFKGNIVYFTKSFQKNFAWWIERHTKSKTFSGPLTVIKEDRYDIVSLKSHMINSGHVLLPKKYLEKRYSNTQEEYLFSL